MGETHGLDARAEDPEGLKEKIIPNTIGAHALIFGLSADLKELASERCPIVGWSHYPGADPEPITGIDRDVLTGHGLALAVEYSILDELVWIIESVHTSDWDRVQAEALEWIERRAREPEKAEAARRLREELVRRVVHEIKERGEEGDQLEMWPARSTLGAGK